MKDRVFDIILGLILAAALVAFALFLTAVLRAII